MKGAWCGPKWVESLKEKTEEGTRKDPIPGLEINTSCMSVSAHTQTHN